MGLKEDFKVIVPRVDRYGDVPTTGVEALIQAHAFLAEEGQWARGSWFRDGDPKEAYETSACGSWQACSMGALGLVTGESPVSVRRTVWVIDREDARNDWVYAVRRDHTEEGFEAWATAKGLLEKVGVEKDGASADYSFDFNTTYDPETTPISYAAARLLVPAVGGSTFGNPVDVVVRFNDRQDDDHQGRTAVLDAFARAITDAGGTPLVDHTLTLADAA